MKFTLRILITFSIIVMFAVTAFASNNPTCVLMKFTDDTRYDLIESAAAFYVSAREREANNVDDRTAKIEQWLFLSQESISNWWAIGITNLKIDGKDFDLNEPFPIRADKAKPILEEDGKKLEKGEKISHEADYWFVYTDAGFIHTAKKSETVNLKWNGKRWIVNELDGKTKNAVVRKKDFLADFSSALSKNDFSVRLAADSLREKYPWLPSQTDLLSGAKSLVEFENAAAIRFIEESSAN